MTTTKEGLQELRGVIVSTIMGDSRIVSTIQSPFGQPSWLKECVTRIIAKGYVTTAGQFRTRFNRFMSNPPKEFNLHQMRLLEHACGCPQYEWERFPMYDYNGTIQAKSEGKTPEKIKESNTRHLRAFHDWYEETERLLQTFGGEAMCQEFDQRKEDGVPQLVASKDGLSPLPPDSTRMIFRTKAEMMNEFRVNADKWEEIYDTHGTRLQMAPDGSLVFDIIPYSVLDRETGEVGVKSSESGSDAA
jgi:hypothetical protein